MPTSENVMVYIQKETKQKGSTLLLVSVDSIFGHQLRSESAARANGAQKSPLGKTRTRF